MFGLKRIKQAQTIQAVTKQFSFEFRINASIKVKRLSILFLMLLFQVIGYAQQDTIINFSTSIPYNKSKAQKIAILNAGLYGGSMVALYAAWYKKYPQTSFHTFNDWDEWKQMDKIGHAYSAYTMGLYSAELWKTTGISNRRRAWIAGLTGATYQTIIETLDGFSSGWGWSWGDIAANVTGSSLFIVQELYWNDQRIKLKTSFHNKHYSDPILEERSNLLFGKSSAEKSLKDYNGQTYWATANIKSFFPNSTLPDWLNVAIGSGAEGLFGARENVSRDESNLITFNRTTIARYRQWYIAPDIDFSKIKTKKKLIKTGLLVLNALKFPAPTIELSNSKLKWHWIYF